MFKIKLFSFHLLVIFYILCTSFRQYHDPFAITGDGVIVYPVPALAGNAKMVKLQVVSDHIIRVIAAPARELPDAKSLITVVTGPSGAQWKAVQVKENIVLRTRSLVATVAIKTGVVSFTDLEGNRIIGEKPAGRLLQPAVFEGRQSWHLSQTFQTDAGDAYYGLGQHQDGVFNYKNRQVFLFQNNSEVAVPFLVSRKNYGILWDNMSLTKAGNISNWLPLSAIKLFAKNGLQGWLTASYANDKNHPSELFSEQAESTINYEYLNDSKLYLPAGFKPEKGMITWEGSLASDLAGTHQFRFTYGGYLKVWLRGNLVLDRWRQAWNPGSALLDIDFAKGEKCPVTIQWIPNGGESYVSVKWLEPVLPENANTFSFSSEAGKCLDYYFIRGSNMDEVIAGYRTLTGRATLMPQWAFGFWQSRERYKTQDEILNTVQEFRKRQIPLDNIVLDWSYWKENDWGSQDFDTSRFAHPDSLIKVLHDQYHTHFMISVWPKFYEGLAAYNEFDRKGWLYPRNIADRQRDWIGKGYVSTFYDAFNPAAQKGFWELLHKKLYSKGVDAWWMDASEPDILSNVSPEKRKEQMVPNAAGITAEYLNAYPQQNAKGIYEGQRSANPDQRVFILTRSAFAGSQRFAAATWSGDIASRWHDMAAQIPAGINFSMSGIPYWTMDIGGFAVEQRFEKAKGADLEEWRELMTRWYQFGAFCPLFRVHGQYPYREIYHTAPEDHPAYKSMLYYDQLRYRLLPYIYSLAGWAYHHHYTLMRGLVMDFPNDTAVTHLGDQYLFGPSLLINPVYSYQQRNRELYLPAGQGWYDLYSGTWYPGGKKIQAAAPYERMPVFVKEGSILPVGPALQYTSEKPADTLTLFVYTGKDASFTLYEDEGTNYQYEKGLFSNITFQYSEKTKVLAIENRKGAFPGMLKNRIFNVVWITKEKPVAFDFTLVPDARVTYNGSRVTVRRN